jgi:hypothetical protein
MLSVHNERRHPESLMNWPTIAGAARNAVMQGITAECESEGTFSVT